MMSSLLLFIERRIREKSIREKGKMKSSEVSPSSSGSSCQLVCSPFSDHNSSLSPQMHSEVVSEMLKEWQEERRRRLRPLRSRDLDDDESRLSRIWVKAKGFAHRRRSPLLLDTLVEQRTMRSCWRCLAVTPPTHTIATVDMLVTVTLENLPNDCLMISELSTYTITCIEYNTHSENLNYIVQQSVV